MLSAFSVVVASTAIFTVYLLQRWLKRQPPAPLPPGPTQLPLIGNLLQWPTENVWETFSRWGEQHGTVTYSISKNKLFPHGSVPGGLVYCNLAGQPIIVINDPTIAQEMLDGKGAIYSDRPTMRMAGDLVGWKDSVPLQQYNDDHKMMRSAIAKAIGTRTGHDQFVHTEEEEAQKLVRRVIDDPSRLLSHIRKFTGGVILRVAYGYSVEEGDDPMVNLADKFMNEFSQVTAPGAFTVDMIPALDKLPDWFPGTGYRRIAAAMRKTALESLNTPWSYVKEQLETQPSFSGSIADKEKLSAKDEFLMKWTATSMYGGGADTTVSTLSTFFLAMTLYPDVQLKAQAELDAVLGSGHLPTSSDRPRLPYINAIVKEVLRWGSTVPAGVAHRLRVDDIHAGYFIPKDAIIVPNIWKFTHDPATYQAPLLFHPERFLATPGHIPEQDPAKYVFGFGRRICPGILLADSSLWHACALSLATLTIRRAIDEEGKEIMPSVEYIGNLITHPKEFECGIKPRSENMEKIIREMADVSK